MPARDRDKTFAISLAKVRMCPPCIYGMSRRSTDTGKVAGNCRQAGRPRQRRLLVRAMKRLLPAAPPCHGARNLSTSPRWPGAAMVARAEASKPARRVSGSCSSWFNLRLRASRHWLAFRAAEWSGFRCSRFCCFFERALAVVDFAGEKACGPRLCTIFEINSQSR